MAVTRRFRVLRGLIRTFTPKMKTIWEEPWDGEPCVFCPNHARAWGPIAMAVNFELRDQIDIWYNHGIGDRKGMPAYVRNDNWWNPKSKLAPLWNVTVPYLAALVIPWIAHMIPGIPVYYDTRVLKTFRASVKSLKEGKSLVIFCQFPDGYESHAAELSKGFLMVAPMAYKATGKPLKFYPVHVDEKKHTILVQKPVAFDPERTLPEQEGELLAVLNKGIYD